MLLTHDTYLRTYVPTYQSYLPVDKSATSMYLLQKEACAIYVALWKLQGVRVSRLPVLPRYGVRASKACNAPSNAGC